MNWIRTYSHDIDYIEDLGGVSWHDALLPRPWHKCTPQTRGWIGPNYTERCACGATRMRAGGPWISKNETRKHRAKARRDAKAPKETVTCRECGQPYEAVAGSALAAERLCTRCWGEAFMRTYGGRT